MKYDNIILFGDFNVCVDDETMKKFCNSYCLKSLIKQPACFKNLEKPSCIDLILTNRSRSFQSTCAVETGLSDFHKMTKSVLKMHFRRLPPKRISYRDFKKIDNEKYMNSLQSVLFDPHVDCNISDPDVFFQKCQIVLDNHAPQKKKYVHGNHKLFMNKRLSKAVT